MERTQTGIECPKCHDKIFSNSRHDFAECSCGGVFVDGGFDYLRYGGVDGASAILVTRQVTGPLPAFFRQEKSSHA